MKAIRLFTTQRGSSFEIEVDGQSVLAYEGESLATVLMAAGFRAFTAHNEPYAPNRLYCGMGTCQQCLVTVDSLPNCQACRTLARPGMKVETSHEN
ncbi:MAG: (2Fe-2S)-binding protein [Chloroflexota bacterium]